MDIGGWLRSLGLVEYEAAFRENKVDAVGLAKLTAGDLKDLGGAAVGDRRKLLEVIREFEVGRLAGVDSLVSIFDKRLVDFVGKQWMLLTRP